MKVQQLLNENNWIQIHIATDKDFKDVPYYSPDACNWCIFGAMLKCYGTNEASSLRSLIISELKITSLSSWNDDPKRIWKDIEALIKKYNL